MQVSACVRVWKLRLMWEGQVRELKVQLEEARRWIARHTSHASHNTSHIARHPLHFNHYHTSRSLVTRRAG